MIGAGLGRNDIERRIDRDPDPHQMNRHAGRANTRGDRVIDILDIDQTGIEIKQSVVATVTLDLDATDMHALSRTFGWRERHIAYGIVWNKQFNPYPSASSQAVATSAGRMEVLKSAIYSLRTATLLESKTIV